MNNISFEKERKISFFDKSNQEKEIELISSIIKVKNDLDVANSNFEYAHDDLIDYYSYQIKANRAKFDYLVKKAKQYGISLNMIDQIDLKLNNVI